MKIREHNQAIADFIKAYRALMCYGCNERKSDTCKELFIESVEEMERTHALKELYLILEHEGKLYNIENGIVAKDFNRVV